MAFFDDIFSAFTGQQSVPQQTIIPTGDLLNQTYGALTAAAPGVIAYNQALAPGLMDVQLGVERQFDPNVANLRAATSKSIIDELGLGTQLPPDLQERVVRQALEGNAASGFGVGPGGRGLVAADLGLTGMDIASRRRAEAQGYVQNAPLPGSLYTPQGLMDAGAVASDIGRVQAAKDEYANLVEDTRKNNFSSLLNTGTRILGGVAGGFLGGMLGNPAGGAMGGMAAGNSIFSGGVAGVPRGTIGGPQYGIGGGGGSGIFGSLLNLFSGPAVNSAANAYNAGSPGSGIAYPGSPNTRR